MTAEATRILKENVQQGTGTKANIGCPAAGKTGTTDSFNDAWFVGFTPRLATAVWVGYPNAQIEMNTEYHGGSVAGGTFPAEIWGDYMKSIKGKFCGDFKPAKTAAHFSPFFGKYARSGGRGTGDSPSTDSRFGGGGSAITPAAPTTPSPTTPDNGKKRKSNGKKQFNPDLYESPPQGAPPTQGAPDGGAVAPTP